MYYYGNSYVYGNTGACCVNQGGYYNGYGSG